MKQAESDLIMGASFLDALIKRSPEADDILIDCGRIRLQRAALAVVELWEELRPTLGREEEKE